MGYGNYPNLKDVKRILVIKLRHLGDVLLTAPVFSNLKGAFPDAKIDAYIWKEAHPMLEGHPAIGDFLLYDRNWKKFSRFKRLAKEVNLLLQIRKKKYDLIINLTEGDRGAIAAWIAKALYRVGFDPENQGFFGKKKIYTHLVKHCPNPRHSVEKNLDALRRIGIFPKEDERKLSFFIPEVARANILELLQTKGLNPGQFVVVHAASRWRFKCLPPALIAKTIDLLEEPVVLTGGPCAQERQMLAQIEKLAKSNVVNLGGETTLKELGALFCLSKAMITVDSVALHMASALNVRVVALFGPTSEKNWGPWQHSNAIVVAQNLPCRPCGLDGCGGSKMSDCLWTLHPESILEAFQKMIRYTIYQK